jgi:galactokinase/mevalonate kinase-like predicted kinase
MLEQILEFIDKMNPEIIIQAPSRINLINPLDAVEGDFWMPSVAINGLDNPLSAFIYIKSRERYSVIKSYSLFDIYGELNIHIEHEEKISKDKTKLEAKLNSKLKLVYASLYRLTNNYSIFWEKVKESNFEIGILTTIPSQSGLGGSTAIIVAILYGLAKYFNLYKNRKCLNEHEYPINRDIIAEMATKVEDGDLKITAGYGDRYVISRGGLSFCSYFGKLYHKEISLEPLAIYDRIDLLYGINNLPIIVCFSGVSHDSGRVHEILRKSYLQEDPFVLNGYKKLAEISWKSRFAIMKEDWKQLGDYFKINTMILDDIMKYVGFSHGIGLPNKILIKLIENHPDVYSAKLTGAGGGGSVFALIKPEKLEIVLHDWEYNLNEIIANESKFISLFPEYPSDIRQELKNAQFFKIKIASGVKKL